MIKGKNLTILTEKEKSSLLNKITTFFKKRPEVLDVYIFGSFASGRLHPLSDIDIAIFVDDNIIDEDQYSYGYKAYMLSLLIQVAHCNNVDLVVLNEANLLLRHMVVTKGIRLFSKDIMQAWKREYYYIQQYLDFKPMLKKFRKAFSDRLSKTESGYDND